MAYVEAMYPLSAEEDLRALRIATNPHLTKKMRNMFDELSKQAAWSKMPTTKPERSREEKFYDAIAAIENARGKR